MEEENEFSVLIEKTLLLHVTHGRLGDPNGAYAVTAMSIDLQKSLSLFCVR